MVLPANFVSAAARITVVGACFYRTADFTQNRDGVAALKGRGFSRAVI
jgi:hypothetical protein